MTVPPSPPAEDESAGDHPGVAECLRLLEAVPAAAASSPAFRRHWPSISASLAALSASLASPAFPPAAPLLAPLAAALRALLSVSVSAAGDAHAPRLGHLHTVSLLSSTAAELAQLAADARLLASAPAPAPSSSAGSAAEDALVSRLRLGSAASRAAALEELASTAPALPATSAAAAVSAVAALLDSASAGCVGDLRDRAVAALAALASTDAARPALALEAGAVVPHLCRTLEAGSGSTAEHACAALLPLTASSRDASAAVAARGGVAALLSACAGGTPAAQAAAAGVLRNLAAYPDLLPAFRDEGGAVPLLLLQLVSLGTPRAQEQALGCLQRLTAGDGDEAQRLKVEVFQAGALACVRDFLDGRGDGDEPPGLAPALGLLRNMASFRYIAEIAAASGSGVFVAHVAAALGSDRSITRTEAALALAELCGNAGGGSIGKAARRQQQQHYDAVVADAAVPRLVWMLEAKAAGERDGAARALAAVLAASSACRKAFRKDERGVVNAVQLLGDPSGSGSRGGVGVEERRFPVWVLLAVEQSRRCRKQMVAAGACGFLQGLVGAEVEGAKRLAECLGKGKMLGVFPRT
ncbi:trans-splicing factor Raa3, chloroplastic-like [Miscanthus floridulus]|uniref:trans-splicing factor Raa3, chloroplastic-like n=1 Tax=Miscanthus floridulus TaxID=154761 RepID=UPI00345A85E3